MKFVMKSLVKLLAGDEVRSSGAKKIKRMGADRRDVVREVVAEGVKSGHSEEAIARRLSKLANTPNGRDKRDWKRVATTEMWDAVNRAALEMIVNTLGPETKVIRPTNPHGNIQCKEFGCIKKKVFEASRVPARLKGAVHPNCNCGPWQAVGAEELTKAQHPLETFPMGLVRKERFGEEMLPVISDGNGRWVKPDSVTGRAIIRALLHKIPLVVFEDGVFKDRLIGQHGNSSKKGRFVLLDMDKLGNAQFYPMDPRNYSDEELAEFRMKHKHSFDDYISKMLQVMPTVMAQPEYWQERPDRVTHFGSFMGFRTLADWYVLIPGKVAEDSLLSRHSTKTVSVKGAVRKWMKALLDQSELRK